MPTTQKAARIEELAKLLGEAELAIVADYRGLKVSDLQGFRATLRQIDGECQVAKNTLTRIAADQVGMTGLDDLFEGPTALIVARSDVVGVSKAVNDFARSSRILTVRGAFTKKRRLEAKDVETLSTLPSREELYAKLLGLMASPMRRTAQVLAGPQQKVAYLLQARIDQLGGVAEPAKDEAA